MAALNDSARTRIGDPWRGTYHLSIAVDLAQEAARLAWELTQHEIDFRTNFQRDESRKPTRLFLAIYAVEALRRLLDEFGHLLEPNRGEALAILVRAREPVPHQILKRIDSSIESGRTYAYIAERMNELGIIDGMGGKGWTKAKVRRAHLDHKELPRERGSEVSLDDHTRRRQQLPRAHKRALNRP